MIDAPVSAQLLVDRVDQTARWCEERADPSRTAVCLRTLDYCRDPFVDRHTLVFLVAAKRARNLGEFETTYKIERGLPLCEVAGSLRNDRGRILAFFPDFNLYHALEASECDSYIDENNNPPCDTWLAYTQRLEGLKGFEYESGCLLSWVPKVFVTPVQRAIAVNAENCLMWLDDLACDLTRKMKSMS